MESIEYRANKCAYDLRVIGHDCENIVKGAYSRGATEQLKIDIKQRINGIEKATEWLNANWRKYIDTDADSMIRLSGWKKDFEKAMKDESNM